MNEQPQTAPYVTTLGTPLMKRWGQEVPMFDDPQGAYSVKKIILCDGQCTSLHVHKQKREYLILLKGTLTIERDDWKSPLVLAPGQAKYLEPSIPHRMLARGDCEYIEVSQGGCQNDAERVRL